MLPALLRVADVQQRLVVPVPTARAGRDADGDLVADPLSAGGRAGVTHTARGVGSERPALATDPPAGLLQPAEATAGSARQGLRVHAPERAARRTHLQLRADHRRV